MRDHQYSWKRKLYWLAVNPLFVAEKWKGVRAAISVDLNDQKAIDANSLEKQQENRN